MKDDKKADKQAKAKEELVKKVQTLVSDKSASKKQKQKHAEKAEPPKEHKKDTKMTESQKPPTNNENLQTQSQMRSGL